MCAIALKSMTYAMKAKNALSEMNISAEIIKLEPSMTRRGCAFGVKFNCISIKMVENALNSHRVRYSEIINF